MSWFKRKQTPSVANVEKPIRLIEDDASDFKGTTLEDNGQYVIDPATRVTGREEPHLHTEPTQSAVTRADAEVTEVITPVTPVAAAAEDGETLGVPPAPPEEKKEGRFAKLKSRLKRVPAEPAVDQGVDAGAAPSVDSENGPADETAEEVPGKPAKLGKLKSAASRSAARNEKPKFLAVPVRVVIGYLPEVTERDAMEYAVGLAEKHFEQIGMSYFDAFKYGSGYAFEAHEGGSGKAYLPEIIRYFDSKGAFHPGEDVKAVIRTATRAVEVQRTREGLTAIILPERDETPPSAWLQPTTNMQPAIHKRTGFLIVGAALFTTGFIAMIFTSMLTRFQEYEAAPDPVVQRIDISQLPNQKWSRLTSIPANKFVRALRYRNGRWEDPELVDAVPAPVSPPSGTPPAPGVVATAAPAVPVAVPPAPGVGATQFPSTTTPGATR